jgi:hypothetical protein
MNMQMTMLPGISGRQNTWRHAGVIMGGLTVHFVLSLLCFSCQGQCPGVKRDNHGAKWTKGTTFFDKLVTKVTKKIGQGSNSYLSISNRVNRLPLNMLQ